jgi:hypothetical protein
MKVATVEEHQDRISSIDEIPDFSIKRNAPLGHAIAKKGTMDGEKFDSKWEAAFYIYHSKIKCVPCERNHIEYLSYVDDGGKLRKWFPDFKVSGKWFEVKGFFRPSDMHKMEQHPEVEFVDGVAMRLILKEVHKVFPDWESQYVT